MKYKIIPLLFLFFSFLSYPQNKAGIIEFEIKNNINLENANIIIPEILTTYLKKINKYKLYERILLNKILEEQSLQLSGMIDEETVVKVGKLFGLDIIISGSVTKIGNMIFLTARAISVETGEITASGTVKFPMEEIDLGVN